MGIQTQKKMKSKIIILILVSILSTYSICAQKPNEAIVRFSETTHNYDTIKLGEEAVCDFSYKNTGTTPLVLYSVFSSCGCTIPEWDHNPLPPGKSRKIKVIYNASMAGSFRKTIVVKSNAKNDPQKILRIKGYVKK